MYFEASPEKRTFFERQIEPLIVVTETSQKNIALQGGLTKITLTYGWHDVIQKILDFYED
jgi:hypothetical protein